MNAILIVKLDASPTKGRRNGTVNFLFKNMQTSKQMPTLILMISHHLNVTTLLISSTRGQFEDAVIAIH